MKLALKIDQLLTEDAAQTLKIIDRRPLEIDITMNEGGGPGVVKVPPATVDMAIPLGAVANGKFLFVSTDWPVTLKMNGVEPERAIPLEPRATIVGTNRQVDMHGQICLVTKDITTLFISNASITETATVLVSIAGD
jgi:hypothetical protein